MAGTSTGQYLFGDLLALARASWVDQMGRGLGERGYADYRRTDAWVVRRLLAGPLAVTQVGALLGVTRQAGRKVVDGLVARGYAATEPDSRDRRRVNVVITPSGRSYARAVVEVIAALNGGLCDRVDPADLQAADRVLRAVLDEDARTRADRLVPPPPRSP